MPVKYNVRSNFLTDPPSFACQTTAQAELRIDEIAAQINEMNPVISVDVAKTVLDNFRTVTLTNLADGNFVTLNRFVSFSPRIPKRLVEPTDPVTSLDVRVAAKIPPEFNSDVQQEVSLERLGYPTKAPQPVISKDTTTNYSRYIVDDYPQLISGDDVGNFDVTDSEQGVFLVDANDVEVRQEKYGLNDPSKIIFTVDLGDSWPASPNVECKVRIKNQYTANGTLRVGDYANCRTMNTVDDSTQDQMFVSYDDAEGSVQLSSYAGAGATGRVQAKHLPDGSVTLAVGTITGDLSDDSTVAVTGGSITFTAAETGLDADVELTVADANAYAALIEFLDARARNVVEYCTFESGA